PRTWNTDPYGIRGRRCRVRAPQKSPRGYARMTPAESRALAWARLVRLPNVFTALADIGLGILVAGPVMVGAAPSTLLLIASACLYCGGMVWNDYFDVEQDRRGGAVSPVPARGNNPRGAPPPAARVLAPCSPPPRLPR